MTYRKTALAILLAVAGVQGAIAGANVTWVGGEAGFVEHPVNSPRSRAQVTQEYLAFRDHPVSFDGTVLLRGEAGYVSAGPAVFSDVHGSHTHVLGNAGAAKPEPAAMTDAEKRAYREQYIN